MSSQPPLLRRGWTGRVYVITRYRVDEATNRVHSIEKHDVTDEYNALVQADSEAPADLPLHRTSANVGVSCSTCDGGGCPDCTDPS